LQVQVSSLRATNESLREEASSNNQRWQRTAKALQTAGSRAAQARADADAAEATATNLVHTLQDLQTVVAETKMASQVLHDDHEELRKATNDIQKQLIMKDADISRCHKEMQILKQRNQQLATSEKEWQSDKEKVTRMCKQKDDELQTLRRDLEEREVIEQARQQRAEEVEKSWRHAQTLLTEATAGQEQAQTSQIILEETISKLQEANEQLHKQSEEDRVLASQEKERVYKALTKAEKDAQQLRIQNEELQEELQRYKLDAKSTGKQISELQTKVKDLEKRIQDREGTSSVSNAVSPEASNDSVYFRLPPLHSGKIGSAKKVDATCGDESNTTSLGSCCCLCLKSSIGLMKKCQCGQPSCDKRAHVSCANKILAAIPGPSVSHPGTPAPRLPLVLCSSLAAILNKS
jgi:hypothetical protein